MEKALEENNTLEKLTLACDCEQTLPREFCRHIVSGSIGNSSLSKLDIKFSLDSWDCPDDGMLVYVRHMLCDSVRCSV